MRSITTFLIFAVLLFVGCQQAPEEVRKVLMAKYMAWTAEQTRPQLALDVPPLTSGNADVTATSPDATKITLTVGALKVAEGVSRVVAQLPSIPDGDITVVAEAEKCSGVPTEFYRVAPSNEFCQRSRVEKMVTVRTKAPVLSITQTIPLRGELEIRGLVTDTLGVKLFSGYHEGQVDGNTFSLRIPYSELSGFSVGVNAVNELGISSQTVATVEFPGIYWIEYGAHRELISIVADPYFRPDGGFLDIGFGDNVWVKYQNGVEVDRAYTPKWVRDLPLYLGALVCFGIAGFFFWKIFQMLGWTAAMFRPQKQPAITVSKPAPVALPTPEQTLALLDVQGFLQVHPECADTFQLLALHLENRAQALVPGGTK